MNLALLLLLCTQVDPPTKTQEIPHAGLARAFVERLGRGEFDQAVASFDDTMKRGLPASKLREVWQGITGQYGPLQSLGESRREVVDKYQVVFVTLEFARGKLEAKVVFDSQDRIAGLFFVPAGKYKSPAYVDTTKFSEVEVKVGKGLFPLAGTLSLPTGDGLFAAVVLVHGSGPHDRDETIGPNRPFRDLAQGLASQGIAVLRYEKRTKQHQLVMALTTSTITVKEETVNDAAAAVETLAGQEKIDPNRIFVLGHSLGGMLLPRIAAANPRPAGFISLAGSTRPLEDLVLEQTKYILLLDGPLNAEKQQQLNVIKQQVDKVKSADLSIDTPARELPLGVAARYWLDLRDYDPAAAAQRIARPMLILQGERDYQVTMDDFARWKQAIGSRNQVKFVSYPTLNHLFMVGAGPSRPIEYLTPGNVAESVIRDVAQWIKSSR
ncbi:Alpha/beta hydrolase family protein [Anatilimnocola aggregata]|uniref:Alpha/beta hydrolase family protein n=1 Tax=Anatilimnocola aggregata TaxID=2528021 RepID=A0A517YN76_9BACT|nr:alpha/beta fold hydrolase [Anatilimnocola aggregata]QDU31665.1 Alpha/beta hydrolase family protein [Anatilimnocola aggregata]